MVDSRGHVSEKLLATAHTRSADFRRAQGDPQQCVEGVGVWPAANALHFVQHLVCVAQAPTREWISMSRRD
jgi:hypothetical protein